MRSCVHLSKLLMWDVSMNGSVHIKDRFSPLSVTIVNREHRQIQYEQKKIIKRCSIESYKMQRYCLHSVLFPLQFLWVPVYVTQTSLFFSPCLFFFSSLFYFYSPVQLLFHVSLVARRKQKAGENPGFHSLSLNKRKKKKRNQIGLILCDSHTVCDASFPSLSFFFFPFIYKNDLRSIRSI